VKLRLPAFVLLAFGIFGFAQQSFACGEKFLIVGRGSRFQRGYVALHPASVLLLNTHLTGQKDLQTRLKLAGHRVQLAADAAQLREAMKSGNPDLILADVSDAPEVNGLMTSTATTALFLPVVDGSSKTKMAELETLYKCPLTHESKSKNRGFLATIDAVLESKIKAKPLDCDVK
jgi:CheY-like chemotaxis protein